MNIYLIIPAHNEEEFIGKTLQSLVDQTLLPTKILVVNDHSTDDTTAVVERFAKKYSFISMLNINSSEEHLPGSKVVQAFCQGLESVDSNYDLLCKFDADLIFPKDYLERLTTAFDKNPKLGISGGFCAIEKNNSWHRENLTDKDHVRGALKAYRKECFKTIGGLRKSMGWDTADELLALFHDWEVKTFDCDVQHLRPTGLTYNQAAKYKQGEAFYKLRYGWGITFIASAKLAFLKKDFQLFKDYMHGFQLAKKNKASFLVNEKEGSWIRKYRWKKIKQKLIG